jgi:membrane protease YdiL (CAAX protease family)
MKLGKDIFKKDRLCLLLNVILFAGMHMIFPTFKISLLFIIFAGFMFAKLYEKYPNIVLISTVHIATNYFGFYVYFF